MRHPPVSNRLLLVLVATFAMGTAAQTASAPDEIEAAWLVTVMPDTDGMPRGYSSDTPLNSARVDMSATTLFANVEAVSGKSADVWRAQMSSSPLKLSRDRVYSLRFSAKSSEPNSTATALFHSYVTGRPTGAFAVIELQPEWQQYSLRLVEAAVDGRYGFEVHFGKQPGKYEFKGMTVTQEPLDKEPVRPEAMERRITEHRMGDFELAVVDTEGRLLPATGVSLTLVRHDFAWGAAIAPEVVRRKYGDEIARKYVELIGENFWGITPENLFKWYEYEPREGAYVKNERILKDEYIPIAQSNRMEVVRGHALEYGEAYKHFVAGRHKTGHFSFRNKDCQEYAQALEARIRRDVTSFKGLFTQYDVFNELVETPSMLRACGLFNTTLPEMFRVAHEIDPDAQLCLNEWNVLEGNNWQEFVEIARGLLEAKAPLHCLGVQAHLTAGRASPEAMWRRLEEMSSLGLPMYITEFSLFNRWEKGPKSTLSEEEQAERMEQLIKLWFSHPAVKGITLWGFWDGNIWIENGGIYRADFTPKPAATMIKDFFSKTHNTTLANAAPPKQTPAAMLSAAAQSAAEAAAGAASAAAKAAASAVDAVTSVAAGLPRVVSALPNGARRMLRGAEEPSGMPLPIIPPLEHIKREVEEAIAPQALKWHGYYGRYSYELFVGDERHAGEITLKPGGSRKVNLVVTTHM